MVVRLAGSGLAFVTVDACALHGTTCTVSDNGNIMQVGPDGAIDGVLLNGTRMVGQLDLTAMGTSACCSAQGTFSGDLGNGYASSGIWTITREIPLNRCQTFGCSISDAIAVLRFLCGLGIEDYPITDLTGNKRIGMEEAIYTLQKVADLR
jgi:hypothetical protein